MGRRMSLALGGVLVSLCGWAAAAQPDATAAAGPDPASVERFGPAYRYPKAGWIVLHIEGKPYERGYQHGRLLAPELADYVATLATKRSPKAPGASWRELRTLVNALFLRRYDPEYLEEMKGIAEGAAAAGAKFEGRQLDLLDVVAVNSDIEVEFLDAALQATPNGLEGRRFPRPDDTDRRPSPPEHCSAFAATGPATADGKIVFGHITMFSLPFVRHFNVWLDIKPERGHRVLMQTYPGGIQSGMDYYFNDAGLLVTETTIAQTKFDIEGQALASRIRKALQYSGSIDEAVSILKASNNGMYTNEWLLGDIKTNEIAMFELGTHKSRLWRSSKDEWFGGTKGFYWGCNNAKDLDVRLETVASVEGTPANIVWHPADRDRTWLRLYNRDKGKIAEAFGFEAFTTTPLAAAHSCDAKFTTSAMAKELKTWALFGTPLGRSWEPTDYDRSRCPNVQPLVGNDWTVLTVDPPPADKPAPLAQRAERVLERALRNDQTLSALQDDVAVLVKREQEIRRRGRGSSDPVLIANRRKLAQAQARVNDYRNRLAELAKTGGTGSSPRAVDLASSAKEESNDEPANPGSEPVSPAWRGTILPGADADLWLAAAFADYEAIVSRELAVQAKSNGKELSARDHERIDLDLFALHSRYMAGVRRWDRDVPLEKLHADLDRDEWYAIASGKGGLLLAELRSRLGHEKFVRLMDDFGRAHAGQAATTAQFRRAVVDLPGAPIDASFLDRWLTEKGLPTARFSGSWAIESFLEEPEHALIVYGTAKEATPQREAAEILQRYVASLWSNVMIPIRSDAEVTTDELRSHHILVVGRPDSNTVAAKHVAKAVPVEFGPASFVVGGKTYAHPASAVIAAGDNPLNPRYEVVLFAGLGAYSTRNCVNKIGNGPPAEVLVLASGAKPRRLVVNKPSGQKTASR